MLIFVSVSNKGDWLLKQVSCRCSLSHCVVLPGNQGTRSQVNVDCRLLSVEGLHAPLVVGSQHLGRVGQVDPLTSWKIRIELVFVAKRIQDRRDFQSPAHHKRR